MRKFRTYVLIVLYYNGEHEELGYFYDKGEAEEVGKGVSRLKIVRRVNFIVDYPTGRTLLFSLRKGERE